MSAVPRFVIRPDDLGVEFDAATIGRGARYAANGMVSDIRWDAGSTSLSASCDGSRGFPYNVQVSFDSEDDRLLLDWASCTCPVGNFCKHAVALLLTVGAPETGPPPDDPDLWRTVLSRVLDEIETPAATAGAPIGLEFSLTEATRFRPGGLIALRPLTIGKRGTWIKRGLTWRQLLYTPIIGDFDRRQYGLLRTLVTDLQRAFPVIDGDLLILTATSPALWPALAAARDAGVALVPDQASGLQAVELIESAALRLDFTGDDAGGATMSVRVLIDGAEFPPGDVVLVGHPTPHGVGQIVDGVLRLGGFDPAPGPTMLDLVAHDRRVHIPAAGAAEFTLNVLPRLAGALSVEVDAGLFSPPTVTGPVPVLTVTMTDSGARLYWSTRYQVNDKHHDFDPAAPLSSTGYRDAAAEQAIWTQATPLLRRVAATSCTWKRQATSHVMRRVSRLIGESPTDELRALVLAADTSAAVAAASVATLQSAVELTAVETAVLCAEVLPEVTAAGLAVQIDGAVREFRLADDAPQLQFSGDEGPASNDWFGLDIAVTVGGHTVPLADVITELSSGATHMLMSDGLYFRLDAPEILRLRELLDEARALGEIDGDKVNARSLNATLWEELLSLGVVDQQVARWQQSLVRLSTAQAPERVEVPDGLAATLRDYQRDGLDWLSFLWDNGIGGVLADDMGLGKTVQTLALIARAKAAGAGRFLVIAPTSVVGNWAAEAAKFTPGLTVAAVTATEARSGCPLADRVAGADIVVTSYALSRIDFDAYAAIDWAGVILDEAQFVKNHNSKTHQCVRRLDAGFKLAITGTPMENNLMELWALLSITVPGLFPSPKVFGDYFRKPIESGTDPERLAVLRRRIKPVMLRRKKSQVATELPAKQEQVLAVELGTKHRKIYDTRLARERQKVLGLLGDWDKNRFQIFRSLTLLRQLSLHPGLVDGTDLNVGSVKVDFLVEQLLQLAAEDHSALVFSQFTGFLGIVRSHLDAAGVSYSYLDGSVSAHARAAELKRFRAGTTQVFLISLKAGGFGLNLTEADYCFLCDPWWSPAAEAQAVDRTHRIGQTRPVTVYRLVSQDTIEEKVVALQERKRELFTAVVDDGELFSAAVTASDVQELLA
ncbi:DEAD/DEAH box helicase [Mycobacterium sp. M1]|uniref:DEAD/DEAH box helicase n=1 Tax=Mycolicibacter acidiphilus TaxID=2835306 RepID=A0ABS5RIH4_9MYCO|nr:DEAD/DEAH box helicase [Mycolicibacter acidiphilus]MBS9533817.1 DEAD/DEAH box helicase [Mycolicibacter acidiphilus]